MKEVTGILLICLTSWCCQCAFAESGTAPGGEAQAHPGKLHEEPMPVSRTLAEAPETMKEEPSAVRKGKSERSKTRAERTAERESAIRGIIEATGAKEMPDRLIDTTFDKLLMRRDAVADDVASAMDEALLPGDLSQHDKTLLHNDMFKGGKEKLQQTKGYLTKLEIPKFVVVVMHHLLDENYTDAELEQLLTFWQSPVGKKTIELLPSMTENFVELAHQYFPPKLEEVQNQMIKNAEGKGHRGR